MDKEDNSQYRDPYEYELLVQNLIASLLVHQNRSPIEIHHRKKYRGKITGHEHEIDLSFTTHTAGVEILVLIECKAYQRSVGIEDLLVFAERIDDIGAHKGIVVTLSKFQAGAIKVADAKGIALAQAVPHRIDFFKRALPRINEERKKGENVAALARAYNLGPEKLSKECGRIWRGTLESLAKNRDLMPKLPDTKPLEFILPDSSVSIDLIEFGSLIIAAGILLCESN